MTKKIIIFITVFIALLAIYIYYLSTPINNKFTNTSPSFDEDIKSTTTIKDETIKESNISNIPKELNQMNEDLKDMQSEIKAKLQEENINNLSNVTEDGQMEQEIIEADELISELNKEAGVDTAQIEKEIKKEANMPLTMPSAIKLEENFKKTDKIIDQALENYEKIKD